MKIISTLALVVSLGLAATAAENSRLWLRYPAISPDGRTLLFEFKGDIWSMPTEGGNAVRLTLRVVRICTRQLYNIASKQSRTVLPGDLNYSYSDGDQYYSWSADSKWLLVQFAPAERMVAPEVGIVAADGASPVRNLTQSGYEDATPKWVLDGKMMIWTTTRDGALSQGGGALLEPAVRQLMTKRAEMASRDAPR